MKGLLMKSPLASIVILIAVFGFHTAPLSAVTPFDLSATQVGGFFADGSADNDVTFQNYYVGYSTLTTLAERRNFFVFDLTSVTTPVVSADFSLILPFGGLFFGGDGMGGFEVEDYILSGTPFTSAAVLDTLIDPASAMMVWDTFGDPGAVIGGTTFDPLSPPMVPVGGLEIVIPLDPLGVALINANLGGELILTGRMLDVSPLVPMGEKDELIFGLSDVVSGGGPTGLTVPFLSLTSVPEPSRLVLAGLGLLGAVLRRRH